jgi:hypothetical protein
MTATSDLLQEALELIRDPNGWCQRKMFTTDDRGAITQFCSVGAIRTVVRRHYALAEDWVAFPGAADQEFMEADAALTIAGQQLTGRHFLCAAEVNDGLTHAEVMVIWKQAIANEGGGEA